MDLFPLYSECFKVVRLAFYGKSQHHRLCYQKPSSILSHHSRRGSVQFQYFKPPWINIVAKNYVQIIWNRPTIPH